MWNMLWISTSCRNIHAKRSQMKDFFFFPQMKPTLLFFLPSLLLLIGRTDNNVRDRNKNVTNGAWETWQFILRRERRARDWLSLNQIPSVTPRQILVLIADLLLNILNIFQAFRKWLRHCVLFSLAYYPLSTHLSIFLPLAFVIPESLCSILSILLVKVLPYSGSAQMYYCLVFSLC